MSKNDERCLLIMTWWIDTIIDKRILITIIHKGSEKDMKKVVFILLITMVLTSVTVYANSYQPKYEEYAVKLKELGVFKGTNLGFELDREPTRAEAAVMFVRLLGAEKEALEKKYEHPFNDVPLWANDYIGYLYHEKLTNGTSATTFSSNNIMSSNSYFTFILRALGYSDVAGDFLWNESLAFGKARGLINDLDYVELSTTTFLRDHVAKISYLALKMSVKDSNNTLIERLVDTNAIDKQKAKEIELMDKARNSAITTALTPEIINRLQSYPYAQEPQSGLGFNEIIENDPELVEWILDAYFLEVMFLEDNEKFFINENTIYKSWNDHYFVRGVYQVNNNDGTVTEQDLECEFVYAIVLDGVVSVFEPDWYFVNERLLSDIKIIK